MGSPAEDDVDDDAADQKGITGGDIGWKESDDEAEVTGKEGEDEASMEGDDNGTAGREKEGDGDDKGEKIADDAKFEEEKEAKEGKREEDPNAPEENEGAAAWGTEGLDREKGEDDDDDAKSFPWSKMECELLCITLEGEGEDTAGRKADGWESRNKADCKVGCGSVRLEKHHPAYRSIEELHR